MSRIGVAGSGIIGRGWAIIFARSGYEVALFDCSEAALKNALCEIGRALDLLEQHEPGVSVAAVMGRIHPCASLEDLVHNAEYIQENIPEDAAAKTALFRELDRLAPKNSVLASSTSALPPSVFLHSIPGRHRCLVAHPGNPPHLIPIVELVRGPWTSDEHADRAAALLTACGKTVIPLTRESPGFVFNRLQGALVSEALRLVDQGIISAEDVDRCVREGLGFRWAVTGPIESMDLASPGGFSESARRYGTLAQRFWPELQTWKPETLVEIDQWCRSRHDLQQHGDRERLRDAMLIRLQQVIKGKSDTLC